MTDRNQFFNNFEESANFHRALVVGGQRGVVTRRHHAGFRVSYPPNLESKARKILNEAVEKLAQHSVKIGSFAAGITMLLNQGQGLTENDLVIEAFRRSDPDLATASVEEISKYLAEYSPEQQVGIINNVKGIYHEVAFVQGENADGDEWSAELIRDPYNPGSDVILKNGLTGETVEVQLKATDSVTYLNEHIDRYPGIDVIATDEVAAKVGLTGSGFSNEGITEKVQTAVDSLSGSEFAALAEDLEGILNVSVTGTTVVALLTGAHSVIKGEPPEVAIKKAKERIGRSLKVSASMGILGAIFL